MIINRKIGEYNHSFPPSRFVISNAPSRFHTYGVLKFRKNNEKGRPRNQMDPAIGHKYPQWREDNYSEQLHLGDTKRRQMGKAVLTYFKELYGICN